LCLPIGPLAHLPTNSMSKTLVTLPHDILSAGKYA
jgi:hypothetical protein